MKDKIDANYLQEKLTKIAKRNKVKLAVVQQEYEAEAQRLRIGGMTENVLMAAINGVLNKYRRSKAKEGKQTRAKETNVVTGFVIGSPGIWDRAETIRRQAKKYIEKNGMQAAIENNIVDGDNHILDSRPTLYGRPNKDFLKPLDQDLAVLDLTLHGFFRHNGEKIFKYGTLQTSDNIVARSWNKTLIESGRYFKLFQVTAVIVEELNNEIVLRSSGTRDPQDEKHSVSLKLRSIDEELDVQETIDKALAERTIKDEEKGEVTIPEQWTPLSEVEKLYEANKDYWNRRVFVKGVVAWINTDRPDAIGMVKMGLMNPDNEEELVVVRIPQTVTIDFGELSEVYVFGKPNRSKYKDQEKGTLVDGDVVIDAFGIYPTMKTPRLQGSAEKVGNEEIIDGWV